MVRLYWQDAIRWYLRLRSIKPDSNIYWSSLTKHAKQYANIRNMLTGEPEWKHFDPKHDIAHDELYSDVFDYFINLRHQLMEADSKTSDDELTKIAKQGCYIAYYAQLSLSDPAAEIQSRSLLNWQTMPPPALWVFAGKSQYNTFDNDHLLSWIPPEYAEYTREAVNVAPDECIVDAESDFYQSKAKEKLVELGLIEG